MKITSVAMRDLDFSYEPRATIESAGLLHQASCEFPVGQVVRLCGPAGAGKSAILKLLAGLLSPQAGTIRFNEEAVEQMSFEEFLPYRLQIGYGFDLGGLLNNRTLAENLALPLQYHKHFANDEIDRRVDEMLQLFHLKKQADKRPSMVPGSLRKATCVARALVMSPQFLILDDPTTGLSVAAKSALSDWIKSQLKNQSLRFVFISSEEQDWVSQLQAIDLEVKNKKLMWVKDYLKAGAA